MNSIYAALTNGQITEGEVINAVHMHRQSSRAAKLAKAQVNTGIGDKVKVQGIRPKSLEGTIGKVVGFNKRRTRADIEVLVASDPFNRSRYGKGALVHGIPLVCLSQAS
jgi:hypothetical protein